MALDPARAALVLREYRYIERSDPAVKAKFRQAQEVVIETNLDETAATAFADALFASAKVPGTVFSFTMFKMLYTDDFLVSPPRYTLSFQRHPGSTTGTYTVIDAEIDYSAGVSTLLVRA